jgi:hypothetical protein
MAREAIVSLAIVGIVALVAALTDEPSFGFASGLLVGFRVGLLAITRRYLILAGLGVLLLAGWPFVIRPYGGDAPLPTLLAVCVVLLTWAVGIAVGIGLRYIGAVVRAKQSPPTGSLDLH